LKIITYQDIGPFLERVQCTLETEEATNSLILGVSLQLKDIPNKYEGRPCLKTVQQGGILQLIAVMTPPFNLVIFSSTASPANAYEVLIRNLIAENWDVPGVIGLAPTASEFAQVWKKISKQEVSLHMRQGGYELRQVIPPQVTSGELRLAVEDDTETVVRWVHAFQHEIFGDDNWDVARRGAEVKIQAGDVYLWELDGRPVSIAAKTRPTKNGISIGLVYTPAEHRRHGYASACVATLSQLLLDQGYQFCALFTDLDNPTSNHIYQEIGYRHLYDYYEYRFRPAG
jgi:predicted GNAT family acetyltransferase